MYLKEISRTYGKTFPNAVACRLNNLFSVDVPKIFQEERGEGTR